MACIHPNPRRVGYIVPKHGPLDGPLYMGSIYSNKGLQQDLSERYLLSWTELVKLRTPATQIITLKQQAAESCCTFMYQNRVKSTSTPGPSVGIQ